MTRVGFIGLGSQGAPMARAIVDGGHELILWARRPESVVPFSDTTAVVAATPAEVGANSDIVGICVVNDGDVRDVVLRADGVLAGMRAGGIVVVHSTVHPSTIEELDEAARVRDVRVVDAPVSGGGHAAAAGNLLVMFGGPEEILEELRPVLATFADPIVHLGPLGSGQVAKLLNNFVFTAQLTLAAETFAFAQGLGLAPTSMAEVLAHGSGGSKAVQILAMGGRSHPAALICVRALLDKDVRLTVEVADRHGTAPAPQLAGLAHAALAMMTDE